ncbi:uncharacterized protein LOC131434402 isoform X2 [Malaya genurostris]|nr:uncharacterized protein LOC131434402 isoform X2 [Malaya genurostris]
MFLIVGDDRHRLKEGITLIGSEENDRYSVIHVQDGSVCPKHAAIRCSPTTRDAHVMDLCSHAGILLTDDRVRGKRIPPLEWHKLYGIKAKISFGAVVCQLEICNGDRKSNVSSVSFFDGSIDSIDCSLEEAPKARSRHATSKQISSISTVGTSGTSAIQEHSISTSAKILSITQNSFTVPSTQQIADQTSVTCKPQPTREDGNSLRPSSADEDDDLFDIPETQEVIDQPNMSEIIDPISNTIGQGEKEGDFFQFDTEEDNHTGDGMFNNPYVEQSQSVLEHLGESNKVNTSGHRKSIQPDRSVDSISFRGKTGPEDTDDDLSKIEWNDSKATSSDKVGEADLRKGSVTPDLVFDKPESVHAESVTPDLEFDRITPQQSDPTTTSKLSLRKHSVESLQEPVSDMNNERVESVTPDLNFDENVPEEIACADPYLAETQCLDAELDPNEHASTSVYDLTTQIDPLISGADSPAFKVPSAYDALTQKIPDKELKSACSLRKLAIQMSDLRHTKNDISIRTNKEIELDPFMVATQPLSVDDLQNAYDLQTQPLSKHSEIGPVVDEDIENDTVPLELLGTSPLRHEDIYNLQTQPLTAKCSYGSLPDEDPEMSKLFRPPANSTCRQSMLVKQIEAQEQEEEIVKTDLLNISPSSNKENQDEISQQRTIKANEARRKMSVSTRSNEETVDLSPSDEEYCLAETMPIADSGKTSTETNPPIKKQSHNKSKTTSEKSESAFKVPDNRSITSSTKSSNTSAPETPRTQEGSGSEAFDFNTPEHPFLNVVKKEKILAVSDMLKNRTTERVDNVARRYKYIFGDSSDEDHEPNEPVFKKKDSKVQVMKYDKTEQDKTNDIKKKTVPERRSKRDKKKTNRYSDDEQEDSKSVASSKSKSSSGGSTRSTATTSSSSTSRSKVDVSVDYKPTTKDEQSSKTRKRKVATEHCTSDTAPSDTTAPKASKSKKNNVEPNEPKAGPSTSAEQPTVTKRSGRLRRAVTEEIKEHKSSKAANQAVPTVEMSKSTKPERSGRGPSKQTATTAHGKLPTDADNDQSTSSASEAMNTSASGSESSGTRKSSRSIKPRLMFTKMSPEPYKRMVTRAGGLIVDMPELASILVSDRVYRTYKFLCAIAKGIPIVGQKYLEQVEISGDFVDPWNYILEDREMERRFKFNLKKSLTMALTGRIFQDYSVIVTTSTKPPPEEIQLIVASAGGRVIKFPTQQPKYADNMFVVSDQKDKDTWPKLRERFPEIEIISTEGFMLSIMQHYKNFRSYRLV